MLELKETLALLGFNGDLSEQSITLIERELGCAFVDALWLRCGIVEARKRWRSHICHDSRNPEDHRLKYEERIKEAVMTLEDSQWNDQKPVTEEEAIIETRLDECLGNLPMLLGKIEAIMDDGKQNTNSTVSRLASDLSAKRSLNSDILYAAESRFEGLELSISNLFRGFGEASSLLQMNQQIQRQRISLKTNANRLGWFLNEANVIRVDHNTVDSLESEVEEAQSRLNAILDSKYLPVMLEINKTERTAELQTIYTKYYETALELIRKDVSTNLQIINQSLKESCAVRDFLKSLCEATQELNVAMNEVDFILASEIRFSESITREMNSARSNLPTSTLNTIQQSDKTMHNARLLFNPKESRENAMFLYSDVVESSRLLLKSGQHNYDCVKKLSLLLLSHLYLWERFGQQCTDRVHEKWIDQLKQCQNNLKSAAAMDSIKLAANIGSLVNSRGILKAFQ